MLSGPVFVIGAARSGTSLLYKALCLHPQAAYISNWVARFPRLPWLAALNRLPPRLPKMRDQVWFAEGSNAYVYGRRRPLHERLFPMPVEGEPLYAMCGISDPPGDGGTGSRRQGERLASAFSSIERYAGASPLISKRIANNRRIRLLQSAFPSARFVDIVRDGRAVAHSLSRVDWWEDSVVWWYGGTPRRWREEGRDPWEICARNWVEELHEIERGLASVPGERMMRLSYEGLIRDPHATLEAVAAFVGLPKRREWEEALSGLRFLDRNDARRERLDDATTRRITAI